MKFTIEILTIVTLFVGLILSGCDRSSNEIDNAITPAIETDRDSDITSNEVLEEVRVYRLENSDRFKEFNRTTSDLKREIENESNEEVKASLETKLEEHEEVQRELNHEIDNFQVSESDNWDEFKDNFSDKMDDFDASLNDFFSSVSTSTSSN